VLALLSKTGDDNSTKELAVRVGELPFLPLLPEGEQRHGLVRVTWLLLQVELGRVVLLPTYSMGDFPAHLETAQTFEYTFYQLRHFCSKMLRRRLSGQGLPCM